MQTNATTIYAGSAGFVYEDNGAGPVLQFVATPEGRALYTPDNPDPTKHWAYEYHLRDHLGNLRFAFRERVTNGDDGWDDSFEEENLRSSGHTLPVQLTPAPTTRRRLPQRVRTGEHVVVLGGRGSAARQIGPSVTASVTAGDSVYAQVWGSYDAPLRTGFGKNVALGVPVGETARLVAYFEGQPLL
jgi:hypothetical protein